MKKVIVIGAGIAGASTAYHLAKLGAEVLIVDRQEQGQATAAAAGIICPWLSQRRNKAWYKLVKAGARYYAELIEALAGEGESDTGYAQVGALCLQQETEKLVKLEERAQQRLADAPEIGAVSMLSEQETIARFPLLGAGQAAVHVSGAARVDGHKLSAALLRGAQRQGARLVHGSAAINYRGTHVSGVTICGADGLSSSYEADEVVVCAGAWARELLQPLGLLFSIRPQKAQILHLELPPGYDASSWPVVIPPSTQYMLTFGSSRLVIGATHEDHAVDYDVRATAGGVYEILHKGLEMAPGLADCALQEVRVGFRPVAPGFLPVLGRMPGWGGLSAVNGLGSSGLTVGPYAGRQLARLVLGLHTELDIAPYDVGQALAVPSP